MRQTKSSLNTLTFLSQFVALSIAWTASPLCFAAESMFSCVLIADSATDTVGETPTLNVRIVNKTSAEAILVGALDGSDSGWRFPKCRLEILDASGKPVVENLARCGNMNPLKVTNFVEVPAGGEFDPLGKGFFAPLPFQRFPGKTPGTYTIRFYYSTNAKGFQDYFGDERLMGQLPAPDIQRLFERVPKLDLKSNELKLIFISH